MSRFGRDYDDEYNVWGLWEGALMQAMSGKRGQQALRDLEAALLALPRPRLIASHIALDGEVCAVGALALYRRTQAGEDRAAVLADLESRIEDGYSENGDTSDMATAEVGKEVGCSFTFAYNLGDLNDEVFYNATPEQRYEKVLAWTRERILAPETVPSAPPGGKE